MKNIYGDVLSKLISTEQEIGAIITNSGTDTEQWEVANAADNLAEFAHTMDIMVTAWKLGIDEKRL